MKIKDCMTRDVRIANPNETIRDAAKMMCECDAGAVPIGENDRLVGMITDRDIAIRAVAEGKNPDTRIREIMSTEVKYCYEDEDVDDVARNMAELQVRRLPVLDRDKRLVGIVALGDLACSYETSSDAITALSGISRAGGQHSQSAEAR
jgi:CBS domain-containing protein